MILWWRYCGGDIVSKLGANIVSTIYWCKHVMICYDIVVETLYLNVDYLLVQTCYDIVVETLYLNVDYLLVQTCYDIVVETLYLNVDYLLVQTCYDIVVEILWWRHCI